MTMMLIKIMKNQTSRKKKMNNNVSTNAKKKKEREISELLFHLLQSKPLINRIEWKQQSAVGEGGGRRRRGLDVEICKWVPGIGAVEIRADSRRFETRRRQQRRVGTRWINPLNRLAQISASRAQLSMKSMFWIGGRPRNVRSGENPIFPVGKCRVRRLNRSDGAASGSGEGHLQLGKGSPCWLGAEVTRIGAEPLSFSVPRNTSMKLIRLLSAVDPIGLSRVNGGILWKI